MRVDENVFDTERVGNPFISLSQGHPLSTLFESRGHFYHNCENTDVVKNDVSLLFCVKAIGNVPKVQYVQLHKTKFLINSISKVQISTYLNGYFFGPGVPLSRVDTSHY